MSRWQTKRCLEAIGATSLAREFLGWSAFSSFYDMGNVRT